MNTGNAPYVSDMCTNVVVFLYRFGTPISQHFTSLYIIQREF